jgi:predicted PurR-regulated permease PerM
MSQEKTRRRFFVVLLALSLVLLAILIRPLQNPFLLAAVLAGVFWPLQVRLSRLFKDRRALAAGVMVFGTLVVLVGPVAGLSAFVIDEGIAGAAFVSDTLRSDGVEGLVLELPERAQGWARSGLSTLKQHAGSDVRKTLESRLNEQATKVAAAVGGALAATWSFVFDATMMLIALYFLLIQGDELVNWLDRTLPLKPGQTRELLQEFKKTSYAVVVSTLVTAAVQAMAALIGYLIARVPHPLFFAAITFFGAFIPAIGAASFTLLAALILFVTGHPYMAIFLAVWAVVVVGLADNVVKPLLLRGGMDMPGAVVFFALIGGLGAFGPIGLILGPLTVAFFVALLRMYERDEGARSVQPT